MSSGISLPPVDYALLQLRGTPIDGGIHTIESPLSTRVNASDRTTQAPKRPSIFTWQLLSIPAFITAAYALNFFLDIVQVGDPELIVRIRSSLFGMTHVVGGLASIALGPFQFLENVRRRSPQVHVWIGRVYMGAILVGSITTFYVSFTSICRPLGQYAFAFLGFIWLVTAVLGLYTIRRRKVAEHRHWMIRNFSLTYAAVMLRWQLPLFIYLGMATEPALTLTGFTSWIPNLLFAEWWIRKRRMAMF